jgi:hypothetical protein
MRLVNAICRFVELAPAFDEKRQLGVYRVRHVRHTGDRAARDHQQQSQGRPGIVARPLPVLSSYGLSHLGRERLGLTAAAGDLVTDSFAGA